MFPEQLKKILNLIKKTGDRVIIFDAGHPDDSYVVMDIDRYAGMLDDGEKPAATIPTVEKTVIKTEPELADRLENKEEKEEKENLTEEDLTDKINREISMWKNRDNSPYLGEDNKPKKAWQIPSNIKNRAQEVE